MLSLREKTKIGTLGKVAAGGLVSLALAAGASANVLISTELEETELQNDGSTEYTMHVYADTTASDVNTLKFNSAEEDIVVPSDLTITGASLPGLNDFFAGYAMDPNWNKVDSTVDGDELRDNVRITNNVFDGPSNKKGKLGTYTFTVNTDAILGSGSFGLNDINFIDTGFNQYNLNNGKVTVQNQSYAIIPEPATFATLALMAPFLALRRRRRMMPKKRANGIFSANGDDVDEVIGQYDFTKGKGFDLTKGYDVTAAEAKELYAEAVEGTEMAKYHIPTSVKGIRESITGIPEAKAA